MDPAHFPLQHESEEQITLRVAAIDHNAPGSYRQVQARDALRLALAQAARHYNECREDYVELDEATHPPAMRALEQQILRADEALSEAQIAELSDQLAQLRAAITDDLRQRYREARQRLYAADQQLQEARRAWQEHLISRLVASDGSDIESALDQLSWNDWTAIIEADEAASVVLKKPGGRT